MKNKFNKKIIVLAILCTFLAAVFFPLVQSQANSPNTTPSFDNLNWWNTQWPYRKLITIDHTLVEADLSNFPVLISEPTDLELAAAAQHNGQDIVFIRYADNTTILDHEIEYYDYLNGQLISWVKIPLLSATTDTKVWMYYGNPSSGNQQHVEATWDTGFLAVHHLQETSGTAYDSTSHNNDGTPYGAPNQAVFGKIDGADYFDGVDDRIELPIVYTTEPQFTMEAWIYAEAGARHFISQRSDTSQGVFIQITSDNSLQYYINGINHITGILLNTWYYVALVYNGTTATLYVNGFDSAIPVNALTWPAVPLCLGNRPAGDRQFHGTMDEVRCSSIARPSSWINTVYANQNNPSAFATISDEEPYEYDLTLIVTPPASGSITANPSGPYYYNDIVTLTAIPNTGYQFDHWSGDLTGSANPANLLINSDKTVTATFTLENQPPVAKDDYATVEENSTNNQIDVLANDSDPDGNPLTIISVTQPAFGSSSQNGFFVFYTPTPGYDGADSFTYKISDGHGGTATATVYVTVTPLNITNLPPKKPNQPIPSNGETNVDINPSLYWAGGDPDEGDTVTYDVYFGPTQTPPRVAENISTATFKPATLDYNRIYYWRIISRDNHNATTDGDLWSFTTKPQGQQNSSITVNITRPLENRFYLRNFRLFKLHRTFIYGPITITTSVTTVNTSVDHVDFLIDGKLKKQDETAPYSYRWAPLISFRHTIKVIAYSTDGKNATAELTVFKWRLHPVLLLAGAYVATKLMK